MERFQSGVVALVGRPNTGKSTLLNAVCGSQLSIVSPKAQTTRDRLQGVLHEAHGQIVFVDTPGVHRPRTTQSINTYMMDEVRDSIQGVDLIWYLVEPSQKLSPEQQLAKEEPCLEFLKQAKAPVLVVLTKSDLKEISRRTQEQTQLVQMLEKVFQDAQVPVVGVLPISAYKKRGLGALLALTWSKIPEAPALYPDGESLSNRPTRYFVAEKIREQLFYQLGDELPYSCHVEIDQFKEAKKKGELTRIEATVLVERETQKPMLIGSAGKKIKAIGTSARQTIEEFLGEKIFLGLHVKVRPDWKDKFIQEMGTRKKTEKSQRAAQISERGTHVQH